MAFFPHSVDDEVSLRVAQDRRTESVLPIVVMCEAAHGCFDTAQDHGYVRKQLLQYLCIDYCGIFRSAVVASVRAICVFGTQSFVGCVFIDHRVHAAW